MVGQWVRCERDAPAKGTWARYAGRVGRVIILNERDREIGVRFTAGQNEPPSWFKPDELPADAPDIRVWDKVTGYWDGPRAPRKPKVA